MNDRIPICSLKFLFFFTYVHTYFTIVFFQQVHPLNDASIQIKIPEMIYIRYILQEIIGTKEERKWKIMECLNCSSVVHGVCEENNHLLFNAKFVV